MRTVIKRFAANKIFSTSCENFIKIYEIMLYATFSRCFSDEIRYLHAPGVTSLLTKLYRSLRLDYFLQIKHKSSLVICRERERERYRG